MSGINGTHARSPAEVRTNKYQSANVYLNIMYGKIDRWDYDLLSYFISYLNI